MEFPSLRHLREKHKIRNIMKKLIIAAIIACTSLSAMSQTADLRKKIEVNGSAETEITPDEIYIAISLKEYFKDNNNKKRVSITELEKELQAAGVKAGIPKEDLMINNVSGYTDYWNKKKDPNFLASKQYKLKVKDLNSFNQIIAAIDPKGIASTYVESYNHSKIAQLKNDLRVKALLNAKEKATALANALGDKLGSALLIQDHNTDYNVQPVYRNYAMMAKAEVASDSMEPAEIDFKKIKLQYTVNVTFEIK